MKIGLALGGGGVLGIAHLALLEELEKQDIKISAISGASAGAIIGGLFASGGVDLVKKFFEIIEKRQLLSRRSIFLAGKPDNIFIRIEEILKELVMEDDFSALKTSLFITATDIDKARMVKVNKGSLIRAIMASSAYPGVFPYQTIDGKRLIDGGVTNSLPVSILKNDQDCDFVIASSLNRVDVLNSSKKLNRTSIAARALDIMVLELEKTQLLQADYCFLPPIEEYRWYNYEKIDEIYAKSKAYAQSIAPELRLEIAKKTPRGFFSRLFSS